MSRPPEHHTPSPDCDPCPPNDPPSCQPLNDIPPDNEPHPRTPPSHSPSPPDLESKDEESETPRPGIGTGQPHLLDAQELTTHLNSLKDTVAVINKIRNASLDIQFNNDDLAHLKNLTEEELNIDNLYFQLSLDMYIILMNVLQETYCELIAAFLWCHPEAKGRLLSYDQIKHYVKNLTGVTPIHNNMCIKSCMVFTSPYKDLNTCLKCSEPRYDPIILCSSNGAIKKPQQSMMTIPIGPQIQALWSHYLSVEKMSYQDQITDTLLNMDELPSILTNYTEGEDYLTHVAPHLKSHDMVLMFSADGAQLYRNKKSDCWIYIWVVYNLALGDCYKKWYILPGGFIPGPNPPKIFDLFFFSGIYHLSTLQCEGLLVWDACNQQLHQDDPFLLFATADTVGILDISGSASYHVRLGCWLMCNLPG